MEAAPGGPAAGGSAATVIRHPMGAAGGPGGASSGGGGGGSAAFASAINGRFPGLFDRIKNILLTPKTEWSVIEPEPTTISKLYVSYAIPLAAFAALVTFVRLSVIGINLGLFGGTLRTPIGSGLVSAVVGFGFSLLMLYLYGFLINALAPTFGGQRDLRQALKIAAYTSTPVWVGSVFGLLPAGLSTLLQLAAAIYAIYLLYLGLGLMRGPRDKAVGYTVAVIVCAILVVIVLSVFSYLTGIGRYGGLTMPSVTREQQQQQTEQAVSNAIGGALGSDDKSKQGIAAAINGFAEIGRRAEQQQAANAGANAAQNVNAAAPAATAATALGALAGNRKVDPVDFHALKDLLPGSLPGMQRTNAEGSSHAALGMKSSEASATYQGTTGARAEIKIADVSAVAGLMDAAGGIAQSVTSESDTGFERNVTIDGQTAHEKYDNRSKHGELSVIVARRFAVAVSGDALDMGALEQYAGTIDYARLEAMRDVGLQP
jgi:hypothetical protein